MLFLLFFESADDKDLFTNIYLQYKSYLLKVACDKLFDKSYIQDCVHDTFYELTKSFEHFKRIESEEKRKSYLITICKRCAIRINNINESNNISLYEIDENEFSDDGSEVFLKCDYDNLVLLICSLDEIYREPILMKYAEGYAVAEISETLGITETNVRQRLFRGRRILIDILEKEGKQ
ncbi:MAG: RNA polymerase sigma factor [Clostridia bacterium]|nr:RNA polymerase sigma factor [Clostridia bacterium]